MRFETLKIFMLERELKIVILKRVISTHPTTSNRSYPSLPVVNTINPTGSIEYILLEVYNNFSNTLENLLAHEET